MHLSLLFSGYRAILMVVVRSKKQALERKQAGECTLSPRLLRTMNLGKSLHASVSSSQKGDGKARVYIYKIEQM